MTKGEFAALLGLRSNSAEDVTIKSAIVLMRSVLSALMPDQACSDSDMRGTKVVEWNGSQVLLEDPVGHLYRLATCEDGNLAIDQNCESVFNLLSVEGSLDKIFDPVAVAELQRLQSVVVEERKSKALNERRAEYERLKAKYEGVSDD